MASNYLKTLFLVLLLTYCFRCGKSDFNPLQSLKVPVSELVGSVRSVIVVVRQVTSLLLPLSGALLGGFRVNNAISDCLDLMDLTVYQLTRSISAIQSTDGKDSSTGNIIADVTTWLSGALTNPDTCKEGFEGTNGIVKALISPTLDLITSLVSDILSNLVQTTPPSPPKRNKNNNNNGGGGRKLHYNK